MSEPRIIAARANASPCDSRPANWPHRLSGRYRLLGPRHSGSTPGLLLLCIIVGQHHDFFHIERLGQVNVSSLLATIDIVTGEIAGCEQNHRDALCFSMVTHFLQGL